MWLQYKRYVVLLGLVFSAGVSAQGDADTVMEIISSYHTPSQDVGAQREAKLVASGICEAEKVRLGGVAKVLEYGWRQGGAFAELWVEYRVQCMAFVDYVAAHHCLPDSAGRQPDYGLTIMASPGAEIWECENDIRLAVN